MGVEVLVAMVVGVAETVAVVIGVVVTVVVGVSVKMIALCKRKDGIGVVLVIGAWATANCVSVPASAYVTNVMKDIAEKLMMIKSKVSRRRNIISLCLIDIV